MKGPSCTEEVLRMKSVGVGIVPSLIASLTLARAGGSTWSSSLMGSVMGEQQHSQSKVQGKPSLAQLQPSPRANLSQPRPHPAS